MKDKRELYIKKSNPIQYFAGWFVEKDLENWISKADLYTEYVNLCMKLDKTPTANNVFSKEVRRYLPYIMEYKKVFTTKEFGKKKPKKHRITGWKGIRVLTDKINVYDENEQPQPDNPDEPDTELPKFDKVKNWILNNRKDSLISISVLNAKIVELGLDLKLTNIQLHKEGVLFVVPDANYWGVAK